MKRTVVALCLTAFATTVSFQQAPRAITLRPADATLAEPFTGDRCRRLQASPPTPLALIVVIRHPPSAFCHPVL